MSVVNNNSDNLLGTGAVMRVFESGMIKKCIEEC